MEGQRIYIPARGQRGLWLQSQKGKPGGRVEGEADAAQAASAYEKSKTRSSELWTERQKLFKIRAGKKSVILGSCDLTSF